MKARRLVPSEQGKAPPPQRNDVEAWAQEIFWAADAMTARSLQTTVGPSELGTPCDRLLVYKQAGTQPTQPGSGSLASIAGTGVHDWLARRISVLFGSTNRYLIETPVEYRGITGTVDLYDGLKRRVVDWKTKEDAAAIRRLFRGGSEPWTPSWTVQTAIYGAGMEAEGFAVDEVAIVIVPRSGRIQDIRALVRPFDKTIADAAIDRALALAGKDPAATPCWPSGLCLTCPFYREPRLGVDLATGCPGIAAPSD